MSSLLGKLVLFGASKAGETYLERYPDAEVIAFIDNDIKRQGSMVAGIPVLPPCRLNTLSFDAIIITSLWIDSIYEQLTTQLNIPPAKINIPNKSELKSELPFSDAETLKLAQQLLIKISELFIQNNIKACIDSGTLLGLIRQGNLLAWDDDIDFAIDDADFEKALALLQHFQHQLPYQDKVIWKSTLLNLSGYNVCLNIEFTPRPNTKLIPFETSLQRRKSSNGRSELLSSAGIFYAPEIHFNETEEIICFGHVIKVPAKPKQFLSFMYGDWQTPKKQMKLNEYDNRRNVGDITNNYISIEKHSFW